MSVNNDLCSPTAEKKNIQRSPTQILYCINKHSNLLTKDISSIAVGTMHKKATCRDIKD